ncbi:MAG: hypothetical protein FJW40_25870 [Acidobacteria bacterium]|nr:hypothetical protein [Acidobacteriota bacterium]
MEICASLSQKGFGNFPGGAWRIFAKPELEYYRWEFERYWAYYLSFGLGAYSRDPRQPVLEAEFRQRFGSAAPALRKAYDAASWVIPYLTATRAVSNSNFGYWPEMDTGGLMKRYIETNTGDDNRFYSIGEYIDDRLARRLTAKATPADMAAQLERWAANVGEAMKSIVDVPLGSSKELASTRTDLGVLAALARYHAARLRAGVEYELFARDGEQYRIAAAVARFGEAVAHWREIARLTDGVYFPNMVFNRPPEQIGHWKDEVPLLESELARLQEIERLYVSAVVEPAKALEWKIEHPRYKLAMRAKETAGVWSRWADLTPTPEPAVGPAERYSQTDPRAAVQDLIRAHRYGRILHSPIRFASSTQPLRIHASLLGKREGAAMALRYRRPADGYSFQSVPMKAVSSPNAYSAEVAVKPGETILYYIEAHDGTSHFHGSSKEPYEVTVRAAVPAPPEVKHTEMTSARVGQDLPVSVTIRSAAPPAAVRLHYRHLDQSEDFRIREMVRDGSTYRASVPHEFIVPGWDLVYAIEAIGADGVGAFYPDLWKRNPFIVVPVERVSGATSTAAK